jgi:DNA-binding MarR family transcriptional regulator
MASTEALDDKAKRVLEAVWKAGGEADTSEIREYTGLTRGQIQYRVDGGILEEEGLVESRLVSASDEGSGSIRVTSLTETGNRIAGRVMDEDGSVTLDKQVENLHTEVDAVQNAVSRVEGFLDRVEERMDEVEMNAQAAVDEALAELGEVGELADLVEEARVVQERYEDVLEENAELKETIQEFKTAVSSLERARVVESNGAGGYKIHGDMARFQALAEAGVFGALVEENGVSEYLGLDEKRGHPGSVDGVRRQDGVEVPAVDDDRLGRDSEEYPDPRVFVPTAPNITPEAAEKVSRLEEAGVLDGLLDALEDADLTDAADVSVDVAVTEGDAEDYARAEKTWMAVENLENADLAECETVKDLEMLVNSEFVGDHPDEAVVVEAAAEYGLDLLGWDESVDGVDLEQVEEDVEAAETQVVDDAGPATVEEVEGAALDEAMTGPYFESRVEHVALDREADEIEIDREEGTATFRFDDAEDVTLDREEVLEEAEALDAD